MGGEKQSTPRNCTRRPGSPPRGRGKVTDKRLIDAMEGITPAWAGKSPTYSGCVLLARDHPRVGGEKGVRKSAGFAAYGSPPHGRGKAVFGFTVLRYARITPAWAGKSLLTIPKLTTARDHPRMGGEKRLRRQCARRSKGSPPRGRGKVHHRRGAGCSRGITPAWAGKSPHTSEGSVRCGDHPRVGGEKHKEESSVMELQGSPPRGRGKVAYLSVSIFSARITPAWAGKSNVGQDGRRATEDHPRVGGEKSSQDRHPSAHEGSPPRGRGKDVKDKPALILRGITPA